MKDAIAAGIGIIAILILLIGLSILGTDYFSFRYHHKTSIDNSIACFQARWVEDHGKIVDLENANLRLERQYQEIQIKYDELINKVSAVSTEGAWIEKPAKPFDENEFKAKIDGQQ